MFCPKCGTEIPDDVKFCPKCGVTIGEVPKNPNAATTGYSSNEPIMNAKVTGIVAYATMIGWVLSYFLGDREKAKFYLNQALIVNILRAPIYVLLFIRLIVIWPIKIIFSVLNFLYFPIPVIFLVFGIIWAVQENPRELPFIGHIRLLN